ncbi:unnamed protein product, partial [Hydatigera taeniaeformis]|uniref:Uncharacterized protein n=1 Tax=Hydatigena taeniaeformis TaxID=6205 RepID=A0A0R3XDD2_HYDTA
MAWVGCGCALVCRKIRRHVPPPFPHTCISISPHSFPLPLPLLHSSASQPHYSSIPRLPSQGAYSGGRLDENGLRALLSRVVFVLTECHRSEDFVPAKRLLTTSLVYHIEGTHHLRSSHLISSPLLAHPPSPLSSALPPPPTTTTTTTTTPYSTPPPTTPISSLTPPLSHAVCTYTSSLHPLLQPHSYSNNKAFQHTSPLLPSLLCFHHLNHLYPIY